VVTKEEREEIICAAVERTLLTIPEVVGNLMANHAALHKINTGFYKAHPEFADRKDVVQSVVEMIEGKNPIMKYEDILDKAVPEITRRMTIIQDVDVETKPKRMPRDFKDTDFGNGEI